MANVFLICPVRNVDDMTKSKIEAYVAHLENAGLSVYWPHRDTDQSDPVGVEICAANRAALENAQEVHVWYDPASEGSKFDIGMAWVARKPLIIANRHEIIPTPHKSIENVILEWSRAS